MISKCYLLKFYAALVNRYTNFDFLVMKLLNTFKCIAKDTITSKAINTSTANPPFIACISYSIEYSSGLV